MGRITFSRADVLDQLQHLDGPNTLLLCGDQDQPRPPAETLEMAERIGCPYQWVPDAGHISSRENPEFVTRALLAFLQRNG
ncbi:hypothetical protein PBOI14_54580 [Pseudomonas sp. Boi14]|nr:hypothetical protein PBOI14_54580 [Pseudomonas sp. Boi14]